MDAFERLLRLPLRGSADRDIAHVVLHCCMQESSWNPYYALVATQLLKAGKAYKVSMQFAIQDRMRQVKELNARQAANLAEFLAHLLAHRVRSA
jgi:nucleolar MIF4G domain-containing protein 1